MRRLLSVFMFAALLVTVVACGNTSNDSSDSDKATITLGQPPYEHVWFANSIIRQVAEEQGYPVKLSEADLGVLFLGLSTNEVDVYPDVWSPSLHSTYIEKYGDSVDFVGAIYKDLPIGWAVPTYVDIDSIEDLKGRESEFRGRVVGYEPGSGQMLTSEKVVEEYGLDYELVSGTVPTMLTEVKRATTSEEPIVFLGYRPHAMFQMFDIKMLDDPEGVFELDDIKTGVSKNLKEKAPDVYQFLENFEIDLDDVEEALLKIEEEDADVDQLATEWIEANRSEIDQWLDK